MQKLKHFFSREKNAFSLKGKMDFPTINFLANNNDALLLLAPAIIYNNEIFRELLLNADISRRIADDDDRLMTA